MTDIRVGVDFTGARRLARVSRLVSCSLLCAGGLYLASTGAAQAQAQGSAVKLKPEVIAKGLDHPWALAFVGDGRMLVTERKGNLRLVQPDGKIGAPIEGLPEIDAGGQGGLLDVITDREFARNRMIYFCYSEPASQPGASGNSTAMASARLSDDGKKLEQLKVIFSQQPKFSSNAHFGCRIVEKGDGTLFLTLGDRYQRKDDAQKLDNHHGKIVRVNKDGSVPQDNPFAGRSMLARNALKEIWSFGHRNVQGAALGPDDILWINEHGPQGGDEINRVEPGKNYGWPVITYGENYGGGKIGEGTRREGMEQPLHYWTPSMAPSGMAFLRSDRYGKAWQGSMFVGALKFEYLSRLEWRDGKMVREEKLLENMKQRVRDVREGPDGLLYIVTDESRGQLIRLLPAS